MRPARVSNVILICAHSKIRIAEARVGFKAANRESFPYIMHIVDEPRKFSPSNVLTYTVYNAKNLEQNYPSPSYILQSQQLQVADWSFIKAWPSYCHFVVMYTEDT